jgi:lauroyl/myristoyl acyltransferase
MVSIHTGALFSHKDELNCVICRKMDGTGEQHVNSDSERKILLACFHMWNLDMKKMT